MVVVGAVRMLGGLEIRRRWRRIVVLALLVGVIGAVVLATVAGARRSSTALTRFSATSLTANLEVTAGDATPAQLRAFQASKSVESFAPLRTLAVLVPKAPELTSTASALDGRFGTVVDRPRLIAGRAANPNAADEATIGEALAAQLHLRVGDQLDARTVTPADVNACLTSGCPSFPPLTGPKLRLRLVGIVRRPLDLGDRGASGGVLVLGPAFTRQYQQTVGSWSGIVLRVRARGGEHGVPAVAADARRIFGKSPQFSIKDLAVDTQGARNAIDVLTVALWVLAGVAALAGLVTIAIILSREVSSNTGDQDTQRALGLTRRQQIGTGALEVVPVAVGGALVAAVIAALASPLFPIGVARQAEPDLGFHLDGPVLALGMAAILVVVLLIGVTSTLRAARRTRAEVAAPRSISRWLETATRHGASPVTTNGVRMAVEPGRGRRTVPVRSAMFGAVFGIVGIVAVAMFASNLDQLVSTPAQYGWTWAFSAIPDNPSLADSHSPVLRAPGVAAVSVVLTVDIELDAHPVGARGFSPVRGDIGPAIVAGRAPRGGDEVALGASTLDTLGKHIGDTVHAQGPDGSHTYTIVGRAIFPKLDQPQPLANGAAFARAGLAHLVSDTDNNNGSAYLVMRTVPGASLAAVEHRVGEIRGMEKPFGTTVPVEVNRIQHVDWLPTTLAVLLAALALLAVGHALVTSVRRRRHEFAILKTLGFNRRQVRTTVAWQATTLSAIGLLVGIPLGLIVGNLVWRQVANGLGIADASSVPVLALLVVIPCALLAVNLLAFFPARAAARTRPAVALRTE